MKDDGRADARHAAAVRREAAARYYNANYREFMKYLGMEGGLAPTAPTSRSAVRRGVATPTARPSLAARSSRDASQHEVKLTTTASGRAILFLAPKASGKTRSPRPPTAWAARPAPRSTRAPTAWPTSS
jgi:hypothetical protein